MTARSTFCNWFQMDACLLLRRGGSGRHVHRFGCGRPRWCWGVVGPVIAIPDCFAGSLPEARADPDEDHQLAYQECRDVGLRAQLEHPDVEGEGEEQPGDDADAEVDPKQREKIA